MLLQVAILAICGVGVAISAPSNATAATECNWRCYLDRYEDLQKAYGTNTAQAASHYKSYGIAEGRDCTCPECNWRCYLNRYEDLQTAYGETDAAQLQAASHYKSHGIAEGRDCTCPECNWRCYLNRYEDLQTAYGETDAAQLQAASHYKSYGIAEGRDCTCPAPSMPAAAATNAQSTDGAKKHARTHPQPTQTGPRCSMRCNCEVLASCDGTGRAAMVGNPNTRWGHGWERLGCKYPCCPTTKCGKLAYKRAHPRSRAHCVVRGGPLGPVIIGGIGVSGTRGAAQMLAEGFGFEMCPKPSNNASHKIAGWSKCNSARDNTVMFKLQGNKLLEHSKGRLNYDPHELPRSFHAALFYHMCLGINFTLQTLYDEPTINDAKMAEDSKWGWKSPRSIYYLPYYKAILGDAFRFIHVVRDGRDVALADNQRQYHSLCVSVAGITPGTDSCGSWQEHKYDSKGRYDEGSEDDPQPRLNFWAKMNRDAYEYGMTHLGPKRYFLLRTEDMALENTGRGPLLARLAAFLNLPKMRPEQLEDLVEVAQGHEDSYGGRKWNTTQRAHLIERFGDVGRSALGLFGYKLYDWGLAKPAPVVDGSRYMH